MLDLTVGIDPGPTLGQCHCQMLRRFKNQETVHELPITKLGLVTPDCVVIEWVDESAGIYSSVRSRAAQVLRTHSIGTSIRDELRRRDLPVYLVSRNQILRQRGWNRRSGRADPFVTDWLELHGYLQTQTVILKGVPVKKSITPGLLNSHQRDALMAALFDWRHPNNQQYLYQWSVQRCG